MHGKVLFSKGRAFRRGHRFYLSDFQLKLKTQGLSNIHSAVRRDFIQIAVHSSGDNGTTNSRFCRGIGMSEILFLDHATNGFRQIQTDSQFRSFGLGQPQQSAKFSQVFCFEIGFHNISPLGRTRPDRHEHLKYHRDLAEKVRAHFADLPRFHASNSWLLTFHGAESYSGQGIPARGYRSFLFQTANTGGVPALQARGGIRDADCDLIFPPIFFQVKTAVLCVKFSLQPIGGTIAHIGI